MCVCILLLLFEVAKRVAKLESSLGKRKDHSKWNLLFDYNFRLSEMGFKSFFLSSCDTRVPSLSLPIKMSHLRQSHKTKTGNLLSISRNRFTLDLLLPSALS